MRRLFPLSRWAYKHFSRNLSGRAWHTTVFFSFFAKTTTRKHVRASVTEKFRKNVKASVPTCSSHNEINNNFWPYNMVTLSWQCCRVPGSGWVRWVYTGRCCLYAHASTCAHCAEGNMRSYHNHNWFPAPSTCLTPPTDSSASTTGMRSRQHAQ